jgi:hypothetical protein
MGFVIGEVVKLEAGLSNVEEDAGSGADSAQPVNTDNDANMKTKLKINNNFNNPLSFTFSSI